MEKLSNLEVVLGWFLGQSQRRFIARYKGINRLRCAVLLKFLETEARFPASYDEVSEHRLQELCSALEFSPDDLETYDPQSGSNIRYRAAIRDFLGFRPSTISDYNGIQTWLSTCVIEAPDQQRDLHSHVKTWCLENKVELPAPAKQNRIINAAVADYERILFATISGQMSTHCLEAIDGMFATSDESDAIFSVLKTDAGKPNLDSVFVELSKLSEIDALALPDNLFADVSQKTVQSYRLRASSESAWDMRRHPPPVRYTLAAAFISERRREVTDGLIELLIHIVHKIQVQAERKVVKELVVGVREVSNKKSTLFKLAEAAMNNPDGTIRDVLFPVVGEDTMVRLVQEYQANSPIYTERVEIHVRNSYKRHYRRMVPALLKALAFQSGNAHHRPIIEALAYLQSNSPLQRNVPLSDIPIDGIVPKSMQSLLIEGDGKDGTYINRISYEICTLRALRNGLRCREIWVNGANRYRNPDEDVPQDFEDRRDAYYNDLNLPSEAEEFVATVKLKMLDALASFDRSLPSNPKVFLRLHGKNQIKVSPLEPQAEPQFLHTMKGEIARRWPLTGLLDIVKEADICTGFTDAFRGLGDREILSRETLQQRLLLCLYALGTNTGLKRILAGDNSVSYDELRHVRERYIHKDAMRAAIGKVVNATLNIRNPEIWGEGTMGCASDSKKIHAWDQNLMSEWHVRYKGRGVMVYWHVEKNSLCVYSQLKRCSSSEVGAMIEGVLRHCTDADIQKQYVDSHGQSEVAFAFCELLGFSLMPRLKAIARQKLYLPEAGSATQYNNLTPILTRPINWDLIAQQYDPMVKYAAALQKGTAHAESILRRFTRNNKQHPVYQALAELGRAVKTTFLCQYLESEDIRREINEALNVVENCNSTVEFIFFARNSEINSNQLANQEISILALHLLQTCLVYVNTPMIQQVLADQKWSDRMNKEDYRALTPLIYQHVTPYGAFELDMSKRLLPDPVNDSLKLAA